MQGLFSRWARVVCLAVPFTLLAQDSETVLRTMVGYNTMKASLPLTEEQRKEADKLGNEAMQIGMSGNPGEALRKFYRGMAVMRGSTWTPSLELAASLRGQLDHSLIASGSTVTLSLNPVYKAATADQALKFNLFLRPAKGGELMPIGESGTVSAEKLPASIKAKIPDAAAGDYFLEARLTGTDGAADTKSRDAYLKSLPVRVQSLADEAKRLEKRIAGLKGKSVPSAEYALTLYRQADAGEANPHRIDFTKEFATANDLLDAVEKGRNPFDGKTGDSRRAYRSAVDETLQPYRLFVPTNYDASKPTPLVVALHGMGGDENSFFDLYANGIIKREANQRGFLVVCPKGRGPASMYRGTAEKDVLDVLATVRREYNVDSARIYLMGHSMGGYGTWSLAMDHPELFAALGPFAGGGTPGRMAAIKHIPQFVVHGDNDKTVPVTQSRAMVAAAKSAGAPVEYIEVPGGSHVDIVVPKIPAMLDYFAKQRKAEPAAASGGQK